MSDIGQAGNAGPKDRWWVQERVRPLERPVGERTHDFCETHITIDAEAARREASRCVECAEPQCAPYCPTGSRMQEWLRLTAEGRFLEAAAVSQSANNFPEICARVCPHERLCEKGCVLGCKGEAMAFGAIERFLHEYAFEHGGVDTRPPAVRWEQSVAVVGGGPSGLACADELNQRGYAVTVFDAAPRPGGMMMYGMPGFKLERRIVERRIGVLEKRGVKFSCGVRIGGASGLGWLFERGFDAVYVGIGAEKARDVEVEGRRLRGIFLALPFLAEWDVDHGAAGGGDEAVDLRGRKVVVLGGGDTAMDCLRTAARRGAQSATCVYRRDEANLACNRREFRNATAESAQFVWLAGPARFLGDASGHVRQVECRPMRLGAAGPDGRRVAEPTGKASFLVEADVVVIAFGFDPTPLDAGAGMSPAATAEGTLVVDENGMTTVPGVFAGGDCVRRAGLVVAAVRDGREVAAAMDRHLAAKRAEPAVA